MNPNLITNPYSGNRALTTNRKNLMLIFHDEVLRELRVMHKAFLTGDLWGIEKKIEKIKKIILEMTGSLRKEGENEISDNLRKLYLFSYGMLELGRIEKNPESLTDLMDIFQTVREGWKGMDSKNRKEARPQTVKMVC